MEGIILGKHIYRDRDLILHLLKRDGSKVSLCIYGGRGGGKKQRGSILEVGHLVAFKITSRKKDAAIKVAKEPILKWAPQKIRNHYQAFYLMCFMCELVEKMATESFQENETSEQFIGLFRVLSNGLFFLDNALKEDNFSLDKFRSLFLGKLIFELGVVPGLERCLYSDEVLDNENVYMDFNDGGFAKYEGNEPLENGTEALKFFRVIGHKKFAEYDSFADPSSRLPQQLFRYLCAQFQLDPHHFKAAQAYDS